MQTSMKTSQEALRSTQRIKAISFDLDDTLWAIGPVIGRANRLLYDWLGARYPRITQGHTVDSLHAQCLAFFHARDDLQHDLSAMRRAFLRTLAARAQYADDFVEEAFALFYRARQEVEPYPEVDAVLTALARTHPLVALTNGNADIRQTPLARHFHLAVSSADVGAGKPDPAMFHRALTHLGLPGEALLHVGDRPDHDIVGARRVGAGAVWLNRHAAVWPDELPPPDHEIPDLRPLAGLLAG